ncbi:MAG: hypothetical protein JWR44_486 [Hymenobacter sp.]|nr:hypothetical protein [Hymenobacter sp.]
MNTPFPWRGAFKATAHYTAAFLLTVMLHELGHAVVSKLLGGQPVLHNTYVNSRNEHLSASSEIAIALAGPLVSLVQGALLLAWAWRRRATGDAALFGLYMGLFGVINFLGYVLTGSFVPYGDIGRAEALWSLPAWATVVLAVLAAAGLHRLVASTGPLFVPFAPNLAHQGRGRIMQALIALPWLLGSILITALSWPLPTLLSLIYPPMSSMVLGAAWGGTMRQSYPPDDEAERASVPLLSSLHWGSALGALVAFAIVYRLMAPGIAL